jgi:hypothetical protein
MPWKAAGSVSPGFQPNATPDVSLQVAGASHSAQQRAALVSCPAMGAGDLPLQDRRHFSGARRCCRWTESGRLRGCNSGHVRSAVVEERAVRLAFAETAGLDRQGHRLDSASPAGTATVGIWPQRHEARSLLTVCV